MMFNFDGHMWKPMREMSCSGADTVRALQAEKDAHLGPKRIHVVQDALETGDGPMVEICWNASEVPSGKHTKNYGKLHFVYG